MYTSPDLVGTINSRRMGQDGYVARIRYIYECFSKLKYKRPSQKSILWDNIRRDPRDKRSEVG